MKNIFAIFGLLILSQFAFGQEDSTKVKFPTTGKFAFRTTMNNQNREVEYWVYNKTGTINYYILYAFSGATWPKEKIMFTPPIEYLELVKRNGYETMLKRNKKRVK